MYIVNPNVLENQYKCNGIIAKYLTENGIPLLSRSGGLFYFAETDELHEKLDEIPFWLRVYKYLRGGE